MSKFVKITAIVGFILGLLALVTIALLGPGFQAGWWDFRAAFGKFNYVVYVGLAAIVLGLAHVLLSFVSKTRIAGMALVGILMGGLAAAVPLQMKRTAGSLPYIHDITTDTKNPPKFVAIAELRKDAPNPVTYNPEDSVLQLEAYPNIKTLVSSQSKETIFAQSVLIANDMGWEIVSQEENTGLIEATETTTWFGFKDDVVIRIKSTGDETVVDVRSKSRMGKSDLGANAKRIGKFLGGLQAKL